MIRNIHIRRLLGIMLGGFAGVSLCVSILPMVMEMIGVGDQTAVAFRLSPYVFQAGLVWAAGGWSVTRTAAPLGGAFIMGIVGLASGIILAAYGLHHEARVVAAGAFGGLLYGFLGGLILGRVLAAPPSDAEAED
jgi:hypothetical protein